MRRLPPPAPIAPHRGRTHRRGFTLLELLIVISIIAILLALILPAVQSTMRTAREAQVQNEIKQMESAIALFKQTYGFEPPSRFKIYTTKAGWDGDNISKSIVRKMFPRADFDYSSGSGTKYPASWGSAPYTLTGAECLVFFLGGIMDAATGTQPIGFSKNPKYPFAPPATTSVGENREGPYFEFKLDRLVPSPAALNTPFKVYIDTLPGHTAPYHPYLYASSYDGRGYGDANNPPTAPADVVLDGVAGNSIKMTYVYYSSLVTATPPIPFKPSSCQIISPGYDHEYGTGGNYNPKSQNTSLATGRPTAATDPNFGGKQEFDNLTNFSSGRLRP